MKTYHENGCDTPGNTPHVRLVGQPEVTIFRVLTCRDLRTPVDVPATWNVRRQRPELVGAALGRRRLSLGFKCIVLSTQNTVRTRTLPL